MMLLHTLTEYSCHRVFKRQTLVVRCDIAANYTPEQSLFSAPQISDHWKWNCYEEDEDNSASPTAEELARIVVVVTNDRVGEQPSAVPTPPHVMVHSNWKPPAFRSCDVPLWEGQSTSITQWEQERRHLAPQFVIANLLNMVTVRADSNSRQLQPLFLIENGGKPCTIKWTSLPFFMRIADEFSCICVDRRVSVVG
jgi:hypothetical protein